MKKSIIVLVTIALSISILLIAGCGGSSVDGTYVYKDSGGGSITLVLSSGKAKLVRTRYDGDTKTDSGTYAVNGKTLTCDVQGGQEFKIEGNSLISDSAGITLTKK